MNNDFVNNKTNFKGKISKQCKENFSGMNNKENKFSVKKNNNFVNQKIIIENKKNSDNNDNNSNIEYYSPSASEAIKLFKEKEKFDQELKKKRYNNDISKINILITGRTGAGKSTLINSIFGENLAITGIGAPITQECTEFSKEGTPYTIIDSKGLEMKDYGKIISDLENYILKRKNERSVYDQIHVGWVCVSEIEGRFEDAEKNLIDMLLSYDIPVIVVITKLFGEKKFKKEISKICPYLDGRIIRVQSVKYVKVEKKRKIELYPQNLDKLVKLTSEIISEGLGRLIKKYENFNIKKSINENNIKISSNSCNNENINENIDKSKEHHSNSIPTKNENDNKNNLSQNFNEEELTNNNNFESSSTTSWNLEEMKNLESNRKVSIMKNMFQENSKNSLHEGLNKNNLSQNFTEEKSTNNNNFESSSGTSWNLEEMKNLENNKKVSIMKNMFKENSKNSLHEGLNKNNLSQNFNEEGLNNNNNFESSSRTSWNPEEMKNLENNKKVSIVKNMFKENSKNSLHEGLNKNNLSQNFNEEGLNNNNNFESSSRTSWNPEEMKNLENNKKVSIMKNMFKENSKNSLHEGLNKNNLSQNFNEEGLNNNNNLIISLCNAEINYKNNDKMVSPEKCQNYSFLNKNILYQNLKEIDVKNNDISLASEKSSYKSKRILNDNILIFKNEKMTNNNGNSFNDTYEKMLRKIQMGFLSSQKVNINLKEKEAYESIEVFKKEALNLEKKDLLKCCINMITNISGIFNLELSTDNINKIVQVLFGGNKISLKFKEFLTSVYSIFNSGNKTSEENESSKIIENIGEMYIDCLKKELINGKELSTTAIINRIKEMKNVKKQYGKFIEKIKKEKPINNKRKIINELLLEWRIDDLLNIIDNNEKYFYKWIFKIEENENKEKILYIENYEVKDCSYKHIYSTITLYLCNYKNYLNYNECISKDYFFSNLSPSKCLSLNKFIKNLPSTSKPIFEENKIVILTYIKNYKYEEKDFISELQNLIPTDEPYQYAFHYEEKIKYENLMEHKNIFKFCN
eukprot:jgi/Orpsp1_1/1175859/evm.model.c7180000055495.1